MDIGSVVDGMMVDCIFDLCSVAVGGTTVAEISDCRWKKLLEFWYECCSNMRRYSAVSLDVGMQTSVCVSCVQFGLVDKMVLEVFWYPDGNYFRSWCHIVVDPDRDGDAFRIEHLVFVDGVRHHDSHRNRRQNGPVVDESTPVHGLMISLDCSLWFG